MKTFADLVWQRGVESIGVLELCVLQVGQLGLHHLQLEAGTTSHLQALLAAAAVEDQDLVRVHRQILKDTSRDATV